MESNRLHRYAAAALVFATSTGWAAMAFAAEPGAEGGLDWMSLIGQLINFAFFFGVLIYYGKKPVGEFFQKRRDTLLADLNEAKRLREEAQLKLDEYDERLASLEDERKKLLDEYHAQGEREKDRLVEEAKRQVEKMRADAEVVIEQEVRKAVAALETQAVDLAVKLAQSSLEKKLDDHTQNTLVTQYVDDLKSIQG